MAGLLAGVVVLLGLNLIVKSSPAAVGQSQAGPCQPVPIALSAVNGDRVYRLWSDGAVDITYVGSSCQVLAVCGPPLPIVPGTCTADVTRNGEVEVNDFLEVLGQWGPCQ